MKAEKSRTFAGLLRRYYAGFMRRRAAELGFLSALSGVGDVLSLDNVVCPPRNDGPEADTRRLVRDWLRVGGDLYQVTERAQKSR